MHHERKVTTYEAQAYANQMNIDFLETSAKNAINVQETFFKIA